MSRNNQIRLMGRGVDVVIATPGRLIDLMDDKAIRLDETRFVVLDEADRMLDMGFIKPVRRIVAALHPRRQSALFSATMPAEVSDLAESLLRDPVRISVAPPSTPIESIEQRVELIPAGDKRARLTALIKSPEVERTIVFARTKRGADRVAENLVRDGVAAEVIHGNKAQNARQKGAQHVPPGHVRGARRHRHRRARHRRAGHHPHHQLRPARRAGELRPPHRPDRPQRRRRAWRSRSARPTRSRSSARWRRPRA
jgi:ATP-dependent RNA helicase RhlE